MLEIMVAVAILGLGLTAILSAQAGAFASASHARNLSQATGLARCKMLEVEEYVVRNGFQAADYSDEGPCCDADESLPMHCAWRVEVPTLPTPEYGQLDLANALDPSQLGPMGALLQPGGAKNMFGGGSGSNVTDIAQQLFGSAGGTPPDVGALAGQLPGQLSSGSAGDLDGGIGLLAGAVDPNAAPPGAAPMDMISGVVMGMVYPDLKTYFEGSSRRVTIDLTWREGKKTYTLTIEQWVVQPQQGIPDDDDDPTADTSSTGTGASGAGGKHGGGTGSGAHTSAGTGLTPKGK